MSEEASNSAPMLSESTGQMRNSKVNLKRMPTPIGPSSSSDRKEGLHMVSESYI